MTESYASLEAREAKLIARYLACDEQTPAAEVELLRELLAMAQGAMMALSGRPT